MTQTESRMPLVPLRGLVVFPNMLLHFDVARSQSVKALDRAMTGEGSAFLVTQRDMTVEDPTPEDLYEVGVVCAVRQILRLPGGGVRVQVEGLHRGRLLQVTQTTPHFEAEVLELPDPCHRRNTPAVEALVRKSYDIYESYVQLVPAAAETLITVLASDDPAYIADHIAQNISLRFEEKQKLLEELRPARRLERLCRLLQREVDVLGLEGEVESKVRQGLGQLQRDQILREQLRVIQTELGEGEDDDLAEYRAKLAQAKLPPAVAERLGRELSRLEKQPYGSAEAAVSRNYLDVCLELPWGVTTRDKADVAAARRVLDREHYGLEKVKERILEYVAVRQLAPDVKGQILCLVGPPGVGKTSVALSVAKALGRKLARVSLGGVHDEAEIRGHRKTYIGAMPGRIITAIRAAGSCNPVMVLDEVDKLGSDGRSDPTSALLEVLDPEQNATFRDNFLELPFDLSQVLFITTANTLDTIPRPLRDRMEIIELPSYTDEEKRHIAKGYLLPRQERRHGLKHGQLKVSDAALRQIITAYTRESGVRMLEQQLARLCRKAATRLVEAPDKAVSVTGKNLEEFLGVPKYHPERQALERRVGVVNGLAWTETGGELLEVEVSVMPGAGKIKLTGNLGDVMKESAQTALSCIRCRTAQLGLAENFYKTRDIHVHFPEGAVPKDGPSAGIAIFTAMASALTGVPVEAGLAMTGEVTLRGRVLPIGGLREKTMAALRSGVTGVILPAKNEKDLQEIDQEVRAKLQFTLVDQVDQVLEKALGDFSPLGKGKPRTRRGRPEARQ